MDATLLVAFAGPAVLGFAIGRKWAIAIPVVATIVVLALLLSVSGDVVSREGDRVADFITALVLIYGGLAVLGVVAGLVLRWALGGSGADRSEPTP